MVAALLFWWTVVGWLLPTLLLLPEADAESRHRSHRSHGRGARVGRMLEAWLRMLLPAKPRPGQPMIQAVASCALHWWAVLLVSWGGCCSIAPLFVGPEPLSGAAAAAGVAA